MAAVAFAFLCLCFLPPNFPSPPSQRKGGKIRSRDEKKKRRRRQKVADRKREISGRGKGFAKDSPAWPIFRAGNRPLSGTRGLPFFLFFFSPNRSRTTHVPVVMAPQGRTAFFFHCPFLPSPVCSRACCRSFFCSGAPRQPTRGDGGNDRRQTNGLRKKSGPCDRASCVPFSCVPELRRAGAHVTRNK